MNEGSMTSKIGKSIAGVIVLIIVLGIFLALPALIYWGGISFGPRLLPWLMRATLIVLSIDIFAGIPLLLFRQTRPLVGLGFIISSYLFGATAWFMGLMITWAAWGLIGITIGLLFLGVGVIPLAIIALIIDGLWSPLLSLIFPLLLAFVFRFLGSYILVKTENA